VTIFSPGCGFRNFLKRRFIIQFSCTKQRVQFSLCGIRFYSGPPLLTTHHCSLISGGDLFALFLRNASKQKQMRTSDRCYFADIFALFLS